MGTRKPFDTETEAALASVRDRIKLMLAEKNANANSLYEDKSLARRMYYQMDKPMTISAELLYTLLSRFPDVSAEWLIRGSGSMIIQPRGLTNDSVVNSGNGNVTAVDQSNIKLSEINVDWKEKYLIEHGELEKVRALMQIYEPIAKKQLGIE